MNVQALQKTLQYFKTSPTSYLWPLEQSLELGARKCSFHLNLEKNLIFSVLWIYHLSLVCPHSDKSVAHISWLRFLA